MSGDNGSNDNGNNGNAGEVLRLIESRVHSGTFIRECLKILPPEKVEYAIKEGLKREETHLLRSELNFARTAEQLYLSRGANTLRYLCGYYMTVLGLQGVEAYLAALEKYETAELKEFDRHLRHAQEIMDERPYEGGTFILSPKTATA